MKFLGAASNPVCIYLFKNDDGSTGIAKIWFWAGKSVFSIQEKQDMQNSYFIIEYQGELALSLILLFTLHLSECQGFWSTGTMWNMFKVNSKDTKMTSVTLFCCLVLPLLTLNKWIPVRNELCKVLRHMIYLMGEH